MGTAVSGPHLALRCVACCRDAHRRAVTLRMSAVNVTVACMLIYSMHTLFQKQIKTKLKIFQGHEAWRVDASRRMCHDNILRDHVTILSCRDARMLFGTPVQISCRPTCSIPVCLSMHVYSILQLIHHDFAHYTILKHGILY